MNLVWKTCCFPYISKNPVLYRGIEDKHDGIGNELVASFTRFMVNLIGPDTLPILSQLVASKTYL